MEPEAKYTLVGVVVIALVAGLVLAMLWISHAGDSDQIRGYAIYFKNFSLSGLQADSDVTMKGIKIGSVTNWEIPPNDIERVKVLITVQAGAPIKTDTQAVINRNLLTGLAHVDLIGSTQQAPELEFVPAGEKYPVIPEGKSELDQLKDSLPEVLANASNLLSGASELFSPENRKSISELLANLNAFSQRLASNENQLTEAMNGINSIVTEVRGLVRALDTQTRSLTQTIESSADALTHDVNLAAQSLSRTLESYQDPGTLLRGPSSSSFGPGEHAK